MIRRLFILEFIDHFNIILIQHIFMDQSVVLGYWAIRGLSERCRQLLEYCQVPYTEEKYDSQPGRERWQTTEKPKLIQKNPAITLPYLIDGDKVVSESDAICIYICLRGKKPELLGRNADEQVLMATIHGVYKDFHPNCTKLWYGKYENEEAFNKAKDETPKNWEVYVKKLSGLLGDKEYFAGGITWIDFVIADFVQTLNLFNEEILKPFPKLTEHQKRIWALPELKAYFASDRFKERPCNNDIAYWK